MKRLDITPRQNWSAKIEALGFDFYHINGIPYWHESACYEFTSGEIDMFEASANELHRLCLRAIERIISERLYPLLGIEPEIGKLITKSWERHDPAIYGRFDLIYDGSGPPKMLEYNADTPSSLFEASVVQWNWLEDVYPERAVKAAQFNSIHEYLVDRWKKMLVGRWMDDGVNKAVNVVDQLYVTTADGGPAGTEDVHTVQYMGSVAEEAGFKTTYMPIQSIGWNGHAYTNLEEKVIRQVFKLYPWEWLTNEQADNIIATFDSMYWFEPIWKMLLSNKGILAILWDMFPEHENLLPAYRDPTQFNGQSYVQKPLLGREGSNITIYGADGRPMQKTEGNYGSDGSLPGHGIFVYQGFGESQTFGSIRPNLGVWMVNDRACGMGVREDDTMVVANGSRFVPHYFTD
jgi:glutathionylspermidine synthase